MKNFTFFSFAFGKKLYASFLSALGLMMLLISGLSFGQTNPSVFDLTSGNFSFTGFAAGTTTAYPTSMQGHSFGSEPAPANIANPGNADVALVASSGLPNSGSFRNEIGNGISILNSGSNNYGAIVVAINTTSRQGIKVTFTAEQLTAPNSGGTGRANGLRLQYRVGTTGNFTDISSTDYITSNTSTLNGPVTFTNVSVPSAAENKPIVQLRWIYFASSGTTGSRNRIRLDEITVSSSVASSAPILGVSGTASHGSICPSASALPITYTITNSGSTAADGVTVVSSDPQFVVSALSSTSIPANGGTATYSVTFTPVSSGAKSATVTVASTTSGSNSPTSSLTGTGTTTVAQAVTSSAATAITVQSATLNGNVTTVGTCPAAIEKGFVYSLTATNADPLVSGTGVTKTPVGAISAGTFNLPLSALSASTGYSYKAYVYDGTTYTYGAVQTFTTSTALTVSGTLAHATTCPNVSASSITYTITNNSNQTVTSLSVSSNNPEFVVSSLSSATISAGGTATYLVTFTPTSSGLKTATITLSGTNAATVSSNLTGTGATAVSQSVTTSAATAVTAKSVTLNGNVTALGVCPASTEKGFVYSLTATNADPLVSGTGVTKTPVGAISAGAFTLPLSALSASTGYSYKAYVYDGTTYTYGALQTFTTSTALAVSGTVAHGSTCPNVAVASKTYTITNNSNQTVSSLNVSSDNPEFVVSGLSSTTIAAGGTATYVVTFTPTSSGAKIATITISGTNAANVISNLTGTGTTSVAQAVTSSAATAITAQSATLNGNVTALGVCPATTEKGFVYSLTATNADPLVSGAGVTKTTVTGISTGAYTLALSSLSPSSGYSFKAYVFDGTTYIYGAVQTFTTLTPPANDDCGGAIALVLDAAAITGNVLNATQSLAATCAGTADDDVWYSFTTAGAGTYTITVVGSTSFDAVVDVRSGSCNGINIFCADNTFDGETETVSATGLLAGTTYYVRVYDYYAGYPATPNFTIAVSSPPATLSTNGTAALSFSNQAPLTQSVSQTFNLSGANLTGAPGNITVTSPNTNFQVSNNNSTWGATTTIAYSSSTLASTPVYVRFTPQSSGAKSGNITFSGGGTSGNPTIALTGTGVLPAPVATVATNIAATSFDANWDSVTEASAGYLLDVSTSPTFGTMGSATVTEGFESGLTGSYQTGNVTLGTGVWSVTNVLAGTTGVNSGTKSAQLQSATGSALVSPSFTNGISTITFWVTSSTAAGAIQVNYSIDGGVNWLAASGSPFTGLGTTKIQKTITLNTNVPTLIQILRTAATINIDDIAINYTVIIPDFVSGYNAKPISGQSTVTSSVTGLAPDTTYYYRLRATDGSPSAYSNVIMVNPASRGGSVSSDQTICSGTQPANLTLTGNNGTVVKWQKASDATFTSPVDIVNTTTTLTGANIGNLTATTYFRAVVQSFANPTANSTYATITVNPLPNGTLTNAGAVCAGTQPQLTFTASAGTAPFTLVINGQTYTNITSGVAFTATGTAPTANTTYTVSSIAGVYCTNPSPSVSTTVTVNPLVSGGTVSGSSTVFVGSTTPYITNGTAGGTWASDNPAVASVDSSTGLVTGHLVGTAVITYTVNSGCGNPAGSSATITVTDITTWTGTSGAGSWNHGVPNSTIKAAISGSYDTLADGNISAFNLTVNAGGSLVITKDKAVILEHELTNNGNVMIESDGNLLQVNNGAANTGAISARREIAINDHNQYNYLISPLVGSNLKTNVYEDQATHALSSAPFTLYYNEANNKFYTSSGAYIPGRGLAVKEPAASVAPSGKINALFTGVPMNGDLSYTLANTGTAETGNNLVGNPYPSNIDIKKLYDDSPGITEKFQFWDNSANAITVQQGSAYKGAAYAVFNAATGSYGTGNPAPGNTVVDPDNPASAAGTKIPNHIVKVGQGFMVKATGTGILNFKNTQRTADQTGSNFFGKNQTLRADDRYWLQLITPSNLSVSNAIVYFDGGNNGFAKDDSEETGTSDALFTFAADKKVVINGRNVFHINDVLNVGTRQFTAGIYKIQLGNKEGVFANGQSIYLKDKQTGIITNLSAGAYSFSAAAGESTGRFEIIYQPEAVLATDAAVKEDIQVYRDGTDFVVKARSKKIARLEIYDASGRLIKQMQPDSLKVTVDSEIMSNGAYLLKINQGGATVVKKILK
ncbi:hypothetical protein CBW16_08370 [Flavobacteriaceae bacterium JJC]|nr:hypothetical protein CBW16_08370 [Flavobacteriaceae bacterium JJC]